MKINVTVENPDLGSVVPQNYEEDTTLGALVANQLAEEFKKTDGWNGIRDRFNEIRDQEIRDQVAPVIAEAIQNPIVRTNLYGEPTGETTSLRELIIKEAREAVTRREDRYGRSNETNLHKIIRAEVDAALRKEIADVVKQVRSQVIDQVGETAKAEIVAAALEAVKS